MRSSAQTKHPVTACRHGWNAITIVSKDLTLPDGASYSVGSCYTWTISCPVPLPNLVLESGRYLRYLIPRSGTSRVTRVPLNPTKRSVPVWNFPRACIRIRKLTLFCFLKTKRHQYRSVEVILSSSISTMAGDAIVVFCGYFFSTAIICSSSVVERCTAGLRGRRRSALHLRVVLVLLPCSTLSVQTRERRSPTATN